MRTIFFQYIHQWKSTAKESVHHSLLFAKFLCLLHLTDKYLCTPTLVYGPSMLPTLNLTGDVLLVEKMSPLLGKIGPGDVVLVRSPENPRKTITKRILGMEGDRVTFLVDPSHSDRPHSLVVPKGHVWIQGDNIYASKDSRHLGPIPYGLILGKFFIGYGHLKTLDRWDTKMIRTVTLRNDCGIYSVEYVEYIMHNTIDEVSNLFDANEARFKLATNLYKY